MLCMPLLHLLPLPGVPFLQSHCKFKTGKLYKIQFSANVFMKLAQISIAGNGLSLLPKLSPQSSCMAYNSRVLSCV